MRARAPRFEQILAAGCVAFLLPAATARAEINAQCCGKWITLHVDGSGYDRSFDCAIYLRHAPLDERRNACAQLATKGGASCQEIAPICSKLGRTPADCDESARKLRAAYDALVRAYTLATDAGDRKLQASAWEIYEQLEAKWNALMRECSGLGPLGQIDGTPPYPTIGPANRNPGDRDKTESDKALYGRAGAFYQAAATDLDHAGDRGNEALIAAGVFAAPIPIGAATIGGAALINDAIKVSDVSDAEALAKAWDALADDPPSIDFETVMPAEKPSFRIPDGLTHAARLGFEASIARREEAAQIRAFTAALERWRGAHAAKNAHAEASQHGELVIAARDARAAALRAADADGKARAAALEGLRGLDATEIEHRWSAMRAAERAATLPPEVASALSLDANVVKKLPARLDALDRDSAARARAFAHAAERADADKALEAALRDVWLPWPPPPDLGALDDLQALTDALDQRMPAPGPTPTHARYPTLVIAAAAGILAAAAAALALRARAKSPKPPT